MQLWFRRGGWASRKARRAAAALSPEQVRKVAVIRHAALGDMVLTRAFLVEARRAFPNAELTLSVVSHYQRGLPHDLVDRVHVVAGSDQKGLSFREKLAQFKALGPQDLIFDLAVTNRSMKTCLLNKARLKIGFPYNPIQARLLYDIATPRSDLHFELDDMLRMLNLFGFKTAYPHAFAMPGEPVRRERPFVIYFAGASTRDKCWPADHFSALMRTMAARYPDHDHLVLEGIQDWERADPILEPLADLANVGRINADTIEETTALVKGAALVVSNDTGIRHVAIVSEAPTVGIFYQDPFRYWPRTPLHDIAIPDPRWPPSVEAVRDACFKVMER